MTKTKTTNSSALLPSLRTAGSGFALATTPLITTPGVSRDEAHIIAEAEKQKLKIQATAAKTAYGIMKAGELQTTAGQVFVNACAKIDAIEEGVVSSSSAPYVKKFGEFQRDQLADQVATLYAQGMGMIQREILTSLPDSAPPQRGLLALIRGE